jgi:signal transduction histidine kinase
LYQLFTDIQNELNHTWAVLGEVYGRQADRKLNRLGLTVRRVKTNLDDPLFLQALPFVPNAINGGIEVSRASSRHSQRQIEILIHQLRTPLTAIRGALEEIRFDSGQPHNGDATAEDARLEEIWAWTDMMLLHLRNAQLHEAVGHFSPSPSFVSLKELVHTTARELRVLLRERGLPEKGILFRDNPAIHAVLVDRAKIGPLLSNLLENAIYYSLDEEYPFQVAVSVKSAQGGIEVYIEDNGIGVPSDTADHIFQEGFRGPEAIQHSVSGQGLGLWVVRQIVRAHGGDIIVTNLHLPTEFRIDLPRGLSERPPSGSRGE